MRRPGPLHRPPPHARPRIPHKQRRPRPPTPSLAPAPRGPTSRSPRTPAPSPEPPHNDARPQPLRHTPPRGPPTRAILPRTLPRLQTGGTRLVRTSSPPTRAGRPRRTWLSRRGATQGVGLDLAGSDPVELGGVDDEEGIGGRACVAGRCGGAQRWRSLVLCARSSRSASRGGLLRWMVGDGVACADMLGSMLCWAEGEDGMQFLRRCGVAVGVGGAEEILGLWVGFATAVVWRGGVAGSLGGMLDGRGCVWGVAWSAGLGRTGCVGGLDYRFMGAWWGGMHLLAWVCMQIYWGSCPKMHSTMTFAEATLSSSRAVPFRPHLVDVLRVWTLWRWRFHPLYLSICRCFRQVSVAPCSSSRSGISSCSEGPL